MTPIGGFFELELRKEREYHSDLIALNTGRNALEYILNINKYKKVYIPYFTCDVILEPIKKLNVEYVFYSINDQLEIVDVLNAGAKEAVLYTNYFGIKNAYISTLCKTIENLIIDNAQSFFSSPIDGIDTFYSCRKYFGVPDGAYLNLRSKGESLMISDTDNSNNRFSHLIKRIEEGAERAYVDFKANENSLINQPIRRMSNLTKSLMKNIDYDFSKQKRSDNFLFLHDSLNELNELKCISRTDIAGPMIYPFLIRDREIKARLIRNKIFVATYWPNIKDWCKENSFEYLLYNNLIALPIDQRYSMEDLKRIMKIILD